MHKKAREIPSPWLLVTGLLAIVVSLSSIFFFYGHYICYYES